MEYEEVQNNEVEALKAIYGPDFKQLPVKSVWNQRPPPKFTITLRPSSDFKESPIEFTLQVEMTPTYPNTKPKIDIVKTTALSGRQTEILRASIAQTVQQMLKNEMIYEITSNLQSQVDDWARSVSEAAPSLEEDMLRRRQIEEAKQSAKQEELQRQREAAAKKEEQKDDSLILEEIKKNENAGSKRTASADTLQSLLVVPESTLGVTTFEHTISISQPFTNSPVEFRQVMDGINVPGPLIASTYLARALLPQSQADTDLIVSLMRIGISSPFWKSSAGTRALHELNTELESIRNVHLPGVVPLSEFSIERFNGTNEEWTVNILTPYSRLTPLSVVLNSTGTISLKTTQVWALQILETLESLHKRGMRHKCICPYSVMINSHPETGETSVLLRHPQYLFNLQKLNKEHPFSTSTNSNTIKTVKGGGLIEQLTEDSCVLLPPESQNDYGAAPSSKWDLWQLGALMTLMVSGKHELQRFNYDPELYLRSKPRQLPSVFIKFLLGMLQPDPSKRPGALELLTDEFFRTNLDRVDRVEEDSDSSFSDSTDSLPTVTSHHQHHPSQAHALAASIASTHTEGNPLGSFGRRRLSSNEDVMFSRYKHDFDEGIVLGKGGFGQVVKARNKLDGRVYAVKKIRATPSTLSHILQEVVLLSRLNHQYVVRYYTVWLEDEVETASVAHTPSSASLQPAGAASARDGRNSNAAIEYDSVSRSTLDQGASNTSVGDDIPSTSLSQFSVHHSLSELDIPSASQDFMSDSGFVEFGFSDASDAVLDFSDNNTVACPPSENQESAAITAEAATAAAEEHKRRARRTSSEKELINRISNITRKTLYIQMEYCENHTLGDLVRQGLYNTPQEYWRLLRQILDALAYIHGEGVIHRDLKPKNIFIDQARNIKIGDFGLARSMVQPLQSRQPSVDAFTGSQAAATMAAAINNSTTMNGFTTDYEEFTTDVGTSLYAAVEITDPAYSKRGYNEKVDIFSLGIIFFEMVWKMDTEMERIVDIRRARTPQIELPRELTSTKEKSVEVSLIKCMLDHDPSRRPSAHGLLKSGRIPVEESDMTVVEALHNMRDQRVVQQLVNALFSRPLISAQQVLYDRINISTSVQARRQKPRVGDPSGCLTMSYVEDTLRSIFQAHGAVENTLFRSRLFPRSPLYKGPTVVELVDVQGTVLQLPYDLTLPHARRLAEIVPDYKKVCAVDTVFRNRLQNVGHHPAKHIEVDFDIMSTEDSEDSLIFDEAETIGVMYDSANTVICSEDRNDLIVVIGHHDILAATLSHCGLSPPQYHAALVLLASGSLDRRNNSALARSNVSTASLDMLNQFAFRESFTRSESRMSRLMPLSERVRRGMARVKAVASTFKQLCATNREPQILFSPLVHTATSDFYINGVIFQLVDVKNLQGNARNFNAGSVLAMGGRYDSLIQSFRNTLLDNRTPLVKAVGFGMSADKLEMIMSKQQQQQSQSASKFPIPSRCQVLVSSLSDTSLKTQGVEAARLLWSSSISTDIAWGPSSADEIVAKAQEEQIPIVVMVKQINSTTALASSNTFKPLRVKRVLANTQSYGDVDLLFTELVPFIQNALGTPGDSAEQPGSQSNPVQLSPFADPANDPSPDSLSKVLVINENSKLKGGRKNKWQLEEKSVEARANFLAELSNAPIISVDLRDDVIQAILSIHPAAVDDWKRRVIGLSPNQKAYIMTVQSKLANEATRSPRMMLYSLKTENVFIYNY